MCARLRTGENLLPHEMIRDAQLADPSGSQYTPRDKLAAQRAGERLQAGVEIFGGAHRGEKKSKQACAQDAACSAASSRSDAQNGNRESFYLHTYDPIFERFA